MLEETLAQHQQEQDVTAEPPAVAVAGPRGVELASPAFLEAVGLDGVRITGCALEVLLARQGFRARGDGRFAREETWIFTTRSGAFTVAWVEDTQRRQRRARLLRTAAHDLRGPVANIRSFLSLLKVQDVQLPPRAARALEVIQRSADRALSLMQEFFISEQAHDGVLELPVDPTELAPLVQKALERARAALPPERPVTFAAPGMEALPPGLVEAMAFQHVLQVALEWCAARGSDGSEVTLQASRRADTLELAVECDGPRLSSDERASLFDREYWLAREGKLLLGFRLSVAAAEARAMGAALFDHERDGRVGLTLRFPLAAA